MTQGTCFGSVTASGRQALRGTLRAMLVSLEPSPTGGSGWRGQKRKGISLQTSLLSTSLMETKKLLLRVWREKLEGISDTSLCFKEEMEETSGRA